MGKSSDCKLNVLKTFSLVIFIPHYLIVFIYSKWFKFIILGGLTLPSTKGFLSKILFFWILIFTVFFNVWYCKLLYVHFLLPDFRRSLLIFVIFSYLFFSILILLLGRSVSKELSIWLIILLMYIPNLL